MQEIKIGELDARDRSSLRGQALLPIVMPRSPPPAASGCGCGGCRSHRRPTARPRARRCTRSRSSTPNSAPASATTSRPAPLAVARRHGRRHRRHRVQVRRAPRDAVTSRKTARSAWSASRPAPTPRCPTVAGCRHGPADRGHQLRHRRRRAPEDARELCRRSRSARATMMRDAVEAKTSTPLQGHHPRRSPTRSTASRAEAKRQFFDIIDKLPLAYQKVNAIFRSPEKKTPGARRHVLHLRLATSARAAAHASRLRRSRCAADDAGDRGSQRRARDRHRVPRLLPDTPQKYLGLYNDTRPAGLARPPRCATC